MPDLAVAATLGHLGLLIQMHIHVLLLLDMVRFPIMTLWNEQCNISVMEFAAKHSNYVSVLSCDDKCKLQV